MPLYGFIKKKGKLLYIKSTDLILKKFTALFLALLLILNVSLGTGYPVQKGIAEDSAAYPNGTAGTELEPMQTSAPSLSEDPYIPGPFSIDKCTWGYGYRDLLNRSNGEGRQSFYNKLLEIAKTVHSGNSDITNTEIVDGVTYCYVQMVDFTQYGLNYEEAIETWSTFKNDNPLFYWISSSVRWNDSELMFTVFEEYIQGDVRAQLNKLIEDSLAGYEVLVHSAASLTEKAVLVHDKLCADIIYARDEYNNPATDVWAHNVIGAFDFKAAVCEGYAKAYQLILTYLGIENIYVTGIASSQSGTENHVWNLVKLDDNEWHNIDVTWDDTSSEEGFTYYYFGMGNDEFAKSHTPNTPDDHRLEFLYALPEISNKTYTPVELYKNGAYISVMPDIASAFEAMTDADAEYTIKLKKRTNNYIIPSGDMPSAKKICIEGNYKELPSGEDGKPRYELGTVFINNDIVLKGDVELKNIAVRLDDGVSSANINISANRIILSGEYCEIYADITSSEKGSVVDVAVNSNVVFAGNIKSDSIEASENKYKLAGVSYDIRYFTVKDGTTYIPYGMISVFVNIQTVKIPATVVSIASDAFNSNYLLTDFVVDENNTAFTAVDGVLYSKADGRINDLVRYPSAKPGAVYKVLYEANGISDYAFMNSANLKTVYIYVNTKSLGALAFANTPALENAYISSGVIYLKDNSFDRGAAVVIYSPERSYASDVCQNHMQLECRVINEYTYKFVYVNDDSSEDILFERTDFAGELIITPSDPEKPGTPNRVYDFVGWLGGYSENMPLVADCKFIAEFKEHIKKFTYTFYDANGNVVKTDEIELGTVIIPPEGTFEKPSDAQHTYTFIGWEGFEENMPIREDVEFFPKYTALPRKYTYTFYDDDGITVIDTKTADYGTEIECPEAPSKPVIGDYRFIFKQWVGYTEGMTLTEDVSFIADYESELNEFTCIFYDDDGVTELWRQTAVYGTLISCPEDPIKDYGDGVVYTFVGWIGYEEGMTLTHNISFVASYKVFVEPYTYKFYNENGELISKGVLEKDSLIPLPDPPEKAPTVEQIFTFWEWEGYVDGMMITEDVEFRAVFKAEPRKYSVTFYDEDRISVVYNEMIPYGTLIELPDYYKESTAQYDYKLIGWENYTAYMTVKGDVEFYAVFESSLRRYTYKFLDYDGKLIEEDTVWYGSEIITPPTPSRKGYVFKQWIGYEYGMLLECDMVFTAEYELYETEIISDVYKYDLAGNYLFNISPDTSFEEFVSNTKNTLKIRLYDKNGFEISDPNTLVGTDMIVKLIGSDGSVLQPLILIVNGDTNGDGRVSITDFVQIKKHLLSGGVHLYGTTLIAADYNGDGNVSITDFVQVKKYILGE